MPIVSSLVFVCPVILLTMLRGRDGIGEAQGGDCGEEVDEAGLFEWTAWS